MTKNQCVKFLVDRDQLDRLKADASSEGFITLSAYLRALAFNRGDRDERINY